MDAKTCSLFWNLAWILRAHKQFHFVLFYFILFLVSITGSKRLAYINREFLCLIFISHIDLKSVSYLHVPPKLEEIKEQHRAMLKNQDGEESPELPDILVIPSGKHLQNLIKRHSSCFKGIYIPPSFLSAI